VRPTLRSLGAGPGIALLLAVVLWAATAAALGPAPAKPFAAATAPVESYTSVAAHFAPVTVSSDLTSARRVAEVASGDRPIAPTAPTPVEVAPTPTGQSGAALAVWITASKGTVHPGDNVTYTVEVRNVGGADATNLVAEAHVPAGTSMGESGCLGGVSGTCSGTSRQADPYEHISHTFGTIHAGLGAAWRFTVTVDLSTPVGTKITNHAHAHANNVTSVTSDDVVVKVQ